MTDNMISSVLSDFLDIAIYEGKTIRITFSTILMIVLIVLGTHISLRIIKRLVTRSLPKQDKMKFNSIFTFVRYFIFAIIFLSILGIVGVNITVFLTASAALFVGLGFALQQLFQDIISGIYMLLDQSLHVGDVVEVEGKLAKIQNIHLRSTRAITRDDRIIIIPNHKFMNDVIYNWTQNGEIVRTHIEVGVYNGSDLELVTEVLYKCVAPSKDILSSPKPIVMLDHFGESSVRFLLHFYTSNSFDNERITSEVRLEVNRQFQKHGIRLPVPVIRLYDGKEGKIKDVQQFF